MKIGFIGLGNVGGKLAGSILRNGFDLTVRDLDRSLAEPFLAKGAHWADSPADMARAVDLVITCLPSPAACAAVMEGEDGILQGLAPGKIWAEMSTTDASEMARLAARVAETGATAIECPVSGGCHRAATGNISIFAGCDRETFERMLPVLTVLGRRVLHPFIDASRAISVRWPGKHVAFAAHLKVHIGHFQVNRLVFLVICAGEGDIGQPVEGQNAIGTGIFDRLVFCGRFQIGVVGLAVFQREQIERQDRIQPHIRPT